MKPLPRNPLELRDRAIAALCADLADKSPRFDRLDAIRSISQQNRRD